MSTITLQPWLHPSLQLPFPFDISKVTVTVPADATVMILMEKTEALIEEAGKSCASDVQVQMQVLWNLKNPTRALSPIECVGAHFQTGDAYGMYGDVQVGPPQLPKVPESEKLPVTILTGFLGAGKTTLLNYILQEQKEKKIAVIENEFGEISIDDALLKQNKLALAEKIVVMDNGCMCCTVRGDLQKGLEQILKEIDNGSKIDQIMIETTGMADPVPIVRTFMTNPMLTHKLRLDGVVTVADSKHILARLDDEVEEGKINEAYQQVAFCDKLLLNKLDLVSSETAIAVKDRLRSINSFAKILPAVKGRVKMSELVNIRAHDMSNFADAEIEKEAEEVKIEHGHGHGHGHEGHGEGHGHSDCSKDDCTDEHGHKGDKGHGGHGGHESHNDGPPTKKFRHDSRVNSMALVKEGEIIPSKMGAWMRTLGTLPKDKGTIFRIKGILALKGNPYKHVFHAVMDVSDEDDAGLWAQGEKKISKIVFIGKGLDKDFIRSGFEEIFS